jgi:site-specific DNA-cytosine methylase
MNVLSLFDGMSCGRLALEKAGIPVELYFASEVDPYAIKVTQANHPRTLQLGDVANWCNWNIAWASIDLLIGGSPCQGFSLAGKQLAFDDPRSKLFFVYVDILNHIRKFNPKVRFLLENVVMAQDYLNIISEYLGVEPVFINSNLVSAQNRQRYYWANWEFSAPLDLDITYQSVLESDEARLPKAPALTATYHKGGGEATRQRNFKRSQRPIAWIDDNTTRHLTPLECERLQTVPEGYTDHVSKTQRYRMLGNGWTIDVVAHIFKSLHSEREKIMKLTQAALDWLSSGGTTVAQLMESGIIGDGDVLTDIGKQWLAEAGWPEEKLRESQFIEDTATLPKRKPEELVKRYLEVKTLADNLSKKNKEETAKLKEEMEQCTTDIHIWLDHLGVKSLNVDDGTTFFKHKEFVNISDVEALNRWYCEGMLADLKDGGYLKSGCDEGAAIQRMLRSRIFGFLPKNVLKASVVEHVNTEGVAPPGVEYTKELNVYVNRK